VQEVLAPTVPGGRQCVGHLISILDSRQVVVRGCRCVWAGVLASVPTRRVCFRKF
jgi:hypothetical protein